MQAGSTASRRMGGETGERGGAGQRNQGNTKKSRGHTQGAGEQQGPRAQNQKKKNNGRTGGHTGRPQRGGRAREVGGTGGPRVRKGTQCLSQRSTMPLTRIEPDQPPRPTIRELMEGRPAGEDDGGVPPKGCLGRPPRSTYRSEDRAEALRHVRARKIQPWRGDDQQRAHGAGEQH